MTLINGLGMRPGGDASALGLGRAIPVKRGLVGAWFLGGTLAASIASAVPGGGGTKLTVVGTPVISASYATLTGLTNYFDTTILDALVSGSPTGLTLQMAGRATPGQTWTGVNSSFAQFIANSSDQLWIKQGTAFTSAQGAYTGHDSVSGTSTLIHATEPSAVDMTAFRFLSGVRIIGTGRRFTDYTANLTASTASTNTPVLGTNSFRIGSGSAAGYTAQSDIAFVAIYNVDLTTTEEGANYAFVKRVLGNLGTPIAL